ncbi:hypothetical protein LTR08_002466 [Meristemomyces frigidus]|nr:hypothetical protein LTR08_002466 [Meristemomyces frigidus]
MNAGQKSARRIVANNVNGSLSRDSVCTSCLRRLAPPARRNATTAAAVAEAPAGPPPAPTKQHIPPVTAKATAKAYKLVASPVVSRPPLLTRDLTSFEQAFYLYQKRLNERSAQPFSRYFYFKKDTPADIEWKRKAPARLTPARDIGVYNAYGPEAWNDEVLVGDRTAEPAHQVDALIRDAEGKNIVDDERVGDAEAGGEAVAGDVKAGEGQRKELQKIQIDRPMPRITEADRANDLTSLNRKLDQNLYLLVKNKDGRWRFPEDRVYGKENMHQAAERVLIQSCGLNMNTWIVGNHPIGHYAYTYPVPKTSTLTANRLVPTSSAARRGEEGVQREEFGEKVFFLKARIMAGQADMKKNEYGDGEFRWLAKEEVKEVVTPAYWSGVRNMLTER